MIFVAHGLQGRPGMGRNSSHVVPHARVIPRSGVGRALGLLGFALLGLGTSTAQAAPRDESQLYQVAMELSTSQSHATGVLVDPAIFLGYVSPYLDVSLAFGAGSANLLGGSRHALDVVPALGYHVGWHGDGGLIVHVFGLARLPIQRRTGANLATSRGVALSGEVGVRFWGCGLGDGGLTFEHLCFGFGLSVRYQQHLSDFQINSTILPQNSSILSVPFTFSIAINPDVQ